MVDSKPNDDAEYLEAERTWTGGVVSGQATLVAYATQIDALTADIASLEERLPTLADGTIEGAGAVRAAKIRLAGLEHTLFGTELAHNALEEEIPHLEGIRWLRSSHRSTASEAFRARLSASRSHSPAPRSKWTYVGPVTDASGVDPRNVWRPVPEDAPEAFKDRYKAMTDCFIAGQCPECLVYLDEQSVVVEDPPDGVRVIESLNLDHLPACPLSIYALRSLADELGYTWRITAGPVAGADTELAQTIDELGIDEDGLPET